MTSSQSRPALLVFGAALAEALALVMVGGVCGRATLADVLDVYPDGAGVYETIEAALAEAADGDTVLLHEGTYTGDGNRNVGFLGKAVVVASAAGDPHACIINCEALEGGPDLRGFSFVSGEGRNTVLRGITVTNGYAEEGGALLIEGSSPTIVDCVFQGNRGRFGAAVRLQHSGASLMNCEFRENIGVGTGALLACWAPGPFLEKCRFEGNQSGMHGGAAYF